jgi:hypothetical protein
MPQMAFELTIPVFEGAKTVHALDCAAAVIRKMEDYAANTFGKLLSKHETPIL